MPIKKYCIRCNKIFFVPLNRSQTAKFCSIQCTCYKVDKICKTCGKFFKVKRSHIKTNYCSLQCRPSHFKIGHKPWNTGIKGLILAPKIYEEWCKKGRPAPKTAFKKGQYSGEKHRNWKGGVTAHSSGYVNIFSPSHPRKSRNYIFEHRLIVEKHLGRYLNRKEVVHHVNGIKTDNNINNLIAFNSESAHQRFHKNPKSVFASEIIFDGRNLTNI